MYVHIKKKKKKKKIIYVYICKGIKNQNKLNNCAHTNFFPKIYIHK
jgi:hypothetical protein